MKNVIMHMSTHPRLLKDVLTQYKSTFAALSNSGKCQASENQFNSHKLR